jgi:hypothetical protein
LPLNQSSRSACAEGESQGGGADAKHFQDLAALHKKADSTLRRLPSVFVFHGILRHAFFWHDARRRREYVTKI